MNCREHTDQEVWKILDQYNSGVFSHLNEVRSLAKVIPDGFAQGCIIQGNRG